MTITSILIFLSFAGIAYWTDKVRTKTRIKINQQILELFSELERKVDFERWPDYVFFFRGEACLFRYNLISGWLWCDRDAVWNKISERKGFDYAQTQTFIKNLVEQHFKMRGVFTYTEKHTNIHL